MKGKRMNKANITGRVKLLVVLATAVTLVGTLTAPVQATHRAVQISWGSDASDRSDCPENITCYNLDYELFGDFETPYELECWVNGRKGWSGNWSGQANRACYYWGQGVRASVVIDGIRSNEIILGQPDPPARLRTSTIDHNSFRVTWSPPDDDGGSPITGYSMTISRSRLSQSLGPWSRTYTYPSSTRSLTFNGRNSAIYSVTVAAINSTASSNVASARHKNGDPPSTTPGRPLDGWARYQASSEDTTSFYRKFKVSWSPPVDDGGSSITGYSLTISRPRLSGSVGPWSRTFSYGAGTRSMTFTGRSDLKATYTIELAAKNSVGSGQHVSSDIITYPLGYNCDIPWWDFLTQCAHAPSVGVRLE